MRIVWTQADLRRGLAAVKRAVKLSDTLPILSHVLLQAHHGYVRLLAQDLEIGITWIRATPPLEEGEIAIPFARLEDLVANLPPAPDPDQARPGKASEVFVEMAAPAGCTQLCVVSGRSRASIACMDAGEFPAFPVPQPGREGEADPLNLDVALFAAMVPRVAFAASVDTKEKQAVLKGILFQVEDQTLTLVARDAHRMAVCEAPLREPVSRKAAAVVPAWAMEEFARQLKGAVPPATAQVVVAKNRAHIAFHTPGLVLSSRLIEGVYPNYKPHFLKGYTTRIVVATAVFASTLKALAQIARADSDLVSLRVVKGAHACGGRLLVSAQAQELGEQSTEVDIASLEGEGGLQVLLKLPQLAAILSAADTPHVAVELRSPGDPVIVKPVGTSMGLRSAYALVPCFRTR